MWLPRRCPDAEARAAARFAAHVDAAVVLLDDAVGERQAQAGAATHGLGREERVEDARQMLGSDAAAVVLDLDPDLVPGVAAAHDDQAALRADRLGRVDEQVQEHLIELRRQALDVGQRAVFAPDVGPVLDLVGDDVQRGVDALVQ